MLNVKVDNIFASAVTGGQLNIAGIADQQQIEVSSAGQFKGENLFGKMVDVTIKGGGTANVYSKEIVKVRVRAGGNIFIYGDPDRVDEATTLGGTIKKIN